MQIYNVSKYKNHNNPAAKISLSRPQILLRYGQWGTYQVLLSS